VISIFNQYCVLLSSVTKQSHRMRPTRKSMMLL